MAMELEKYKSSENQLVDMKNELQDQKQQNQMMHDLLQHFMNQNGAEFEKNVKKEKNPLSFSKKFGSFRRKSGDSSSTRRTSRDTRDTVSESGSVNGSKMCTIQ